MMKEPSKAESNSTNPSLWTYNKPVPKRSSLFGQTLDNSERKCKNEPPSEEYYQQIVKELKDWDTLLSAKSNRIGQLQKLNLKDLSVLTEESKNYILSGTNLLNDHTKELNELSRLFNFYVNERMALLNEKNALIVILNEIADEETANIIEDSLED